MTTKTKAPTGGHGPSPKRFFVLHLYELLKLRPDMHLQHVVSPDGSPVGLVHFFCRVLMDLLCQEKPDFLVLVMAVRTEYGLSVFVPGVGNRLLADGMQCIQEIANSQGIPTLVPWRSGSGTIASLVHRVTEPDIQMLLVTRGVKVRQLVSDRVALYDLTRRRCWGLDEYRKSFGCMPEQWPEIMTLKQCLRITYKEAAAMIARYGSIEELIRNGCQLGEVVRRILWANESDLLEYADYHKLDHPAPIDLPLEACRWNGFRFKPLYQHFRRLGFKSLCRQVKKLESEQEREDQAPPPTLATVF